MKFFNYTLFFFLFVTQICFAQWYMQNSFTAWSITSVHFTDSSNGYTVSDGEIDIGYIFRTTDGGENWTSSFFRDCPTSIYFIDLNFGWATSCWEGVGKTTNGGVTWIFQGLPYVLGCSLNSICFNDNSIGWTVGLAGLLYKTTDGGENWIEQTSTTLEDLFDIDFIDENNGIVVGAGGIILLTTNGGENWTEQTSGTIENLYGVSFIDEQNIITAGASGTILSTTNAGVGWIVQNSGTNHSLRSICFTDINNGWIAGSEGTILRTSDGGNNWTNQLSGVSEGLNSIYFANNHDGWAVGDNGTILHTTNGGVTFVEEEQIDAIPTEFLLSQNYPNPFNPSTKIKYSIPNVETRHASSLQMVTLKVYDVLGNEIETLTNEEKPAGTYEVTWYAAALPSGVYFYQLRATPSSGQAGSFVETKKMLLLK